MRDAVFQFGEADRRNAQCVRVRFEALTQFGITLVDDVDTRFGIEHERQRIATRLSNGRSSRFGMLPRDFAAKYPPQSLPQGRNMS